MRYESDPGVTHFGSTNQGIQNLQSFDAEPAVISFPRVSTTDPDNPVH